MMADRLLELPDELIQKILFTDWASWVLMRLLFAYRGTSGG